MAGGAGARFTDRGAMANGANACLRSLLVTYSFEDYDDYGPRAIVPRALPLDPPFTPATLDYKVQVPSEVEEIELEAPRSPQTEVEITGNTELQFGCNTVRLQLTNTQTGERVSYQVIVERKRPRSFWFKLAKIGTISSVLVVGSILVVQHVTKSSAHSSEETNRDIKHNQKRDGIRLWPRRLGSFLEEVAAPFI